jgi:archaellum component FlaC
MVCGKSLHKIPKVLNKLEKNIQTLKKYCTEISREKHTKRSKKTSSKNINGQKIIGLEKLSCNVEP